MFEAIFLWAREIRSSSEIKPLSSCAVCKAKASINVSVELMAIFEERSSEMSQWQSKKRSEIWNDKKKKHYRLNLSKGFLTIFFSLFFRLVLRCDVYEKLFVYIRLWNPCENIYSVRFLANPLFINFLDGRAAQMFVSLCYCNWK